MHNALQHEVEVAVAEAWLAGYVPKKEIVARFAGRAGQSSLYHWIARKVAILDAGPVRERVRDLIVDVAPEAPTPRASSAEIVSLPPGDMPMSVQTIRFLEKFQEAFGKLDAIMRVACHPDGTIKNVRLALEVTREMGSMLARAARTHAILKDFGRQEEFLEALVNVVLEEPPHVRDRLVRKLRPYVAPATRLDGT